MHFGFSLQVRKHNRHVAAKFPNQLTAGSAGRSECVGIGDHSDCVETAFALADRFEDRDAFGTDGEAVRRVFDVAAAEDSSGSGAKCGADAEIRISGVGVFARLFRDTNQMIEVGHGAIVSQTRGDDEKIYGSLSSSVTTAGRVAKCRSTGWRDG